MNEVKEASKEKERERERKERRGKGVKTDRSKQCVESVCLPLSTPLSSVSVLQERTLMNMAALCGRRGHSR